MNKGNILYLGIAASLIVISIVQWTAQEMLPMSIYASIAWASLEVTILELIKTIIHYIQVLQNRMVEITQNELDLCNKHISVMSKYVMLKAEVEHHSSFRLSLIERLEKMNTNKSKIRIEKVANIISSFQMVFTCIMVTLTMLKNIPNDLANNKIVGIISLLAFAFLMLSYYIKNNIETVLLKSKLLIGNVNELENYYLDLFEKAAKESNQNEKEK